MKLRANRSHSPTSSLPFLLAGILVLLSSQEIVAGGPERYEEQSTAGSQTTLRDELRRGVTTNADVTKSKQSVPPHLVAPWSDSGRFPSWLSAKALGEVTRSRDLDRLVSPDLQSYLVELRTSRVESSSACIDYGEVYDEIPNPPLRGTLERAFEGAQFVFRARVTASEGGFFGSVPGTLLRLEPIEVFRREPTVHQAASYLVFLPVGRVELGFATICKRDHRFPDLPVVGDETLVFVPKWSGASAGELLNLIDENGLLTLRQDGTVSLPAGYQKSSANMTEDDVVIAAVRAIAQKKAGEQ
jgi:hypothetical protein